MGHAGRAVPTVPTLAPLAKTGPWTGQELSLHGSPQPLFGLVSLVSFFGDLAISSPSKMWADNALLSTLIISRNKGTTNL